MVSAMPDRVNSRRRVFRGSAPRGQVVQSSAGKKVPSHTSPDSRSCTTRKPKTTRPTAVRRRLRVGSSTSRAIMTPKSAASGTWIQLVRPKTMMSGDKAVRATVPRAAAGPARRREATQAAPKHTPTQPKPTRARARGDRPTSCSQAPSMNWYQPVDSQSAPGRPFRTVLRPSSQAK